MSPKAEKIADKISEVFGLCGHGKEGNWSVKVADYFFIDCGCCWFWRGVTVGIASSVVLFAVIAVLIREI